MAVVVSCLADTWEEVRDLALREARLADLVEIRLDRAGDPGPAALQALFAACPKPVIVACNGPEAFGHWRGTLEAKLELLRRAALCGARFVDVDWRAALELGPVNAPCHRIVSRHDPAQTPADLAGMQAEVQEVLGEGDVTKLVTHARSTEDALRFLAWLSTTKGVVGFCSGNEGRVSRLLAPIFGSPFTYCAPARQAGEASRPSAPGQVPLADFLAFVPPGGLSQETAVFGVVGKPIGHSLSPWVHGLALKAARLDAVYVALEPDDFDCFLALVAQPNWRGLSVTAPFKERAFDLAVQRDEASQRTRAANTLLRAERGWRAANTDVAAVRDALQRGLGAHGRTDGRPAKLEGAHVLVLGGGGAARAVVWAARSSGARATVASRRPEAAQALARDLGAEFASWESIPDLAYDVLVNATPVGGVARPAELVVPEAWIRPSSLVLDAVYRPIRTAFLAAALRRGCTPVSGAEWFVRQATLQFRLFTNQEPQEDLMRRAFESVIAGNAAS
jgi:3-dehydroquinate dehydratase/shikimate dehydrogenase